MITPTLATLCFQIKQGASLHRLTSLVPIRESLHAALREPHCKVWKQDRGTFFISKPLACVQTVKPKPCFTARLKP